MPIPSPYTYDTLIQLAQKGTSLGKDALCPKKSCGARGKLVYTGSRVARQIICLEDDKGCVHKVIKVPLAKCQTCGGRFRVLPRNILPNKHYSLPVIETACRLSFEDNRGPRRTSAVMEEHGSIHPHCSTIYHWQGDIGKRVLDWAKPIGTVSVPTSALVAESAKRLDPGLNEQWQQPVNVPAHPLRSQRRQEQLEACLRLLLAATFLFREVLHALTDWSAWLTGHFHVFAWGFPSRGGCTTFQNGASTGVLLPSSGEGKISGEEQDHGSRSPPHSNLAIPTDKPPA